MNEQAIIEQTREYIRENYLYTRPDARIGEDDHLQDTGVVDSMGMVELVTFLQDTFGFTAQDDEITEQNFATLRRIAQYVARKRDAGQVAA